MQTGRVVEKEKASCLNNNSYFCGKFTTTLGTNTSKSHIFEIIGKLHRYGVTWIVVFALMFVSNQGTELPHRLLSTVSDVLLLMLFSSFDWYVLVEKLLNGKRYPFFYVMSFVTIAAFSTISMFMEIEINRFFDEEQELEYYVLFLMRIIWYVVIATIVLVIYYQQKENENIRVQERLRTEKLSAELRYLKTQINPHFLFNAINNIYSMVYMKNEQAPENILKLSEMLRYVLVDCQAEVIPLHKEIKNIENYVDFQSVTLGTKANISFEIDVEQPDFMIVPMLMQPIVENCFKYSRLNSNPNGFVRIRIKQKGDRLVFETLNSISGVNVVDTRKSGIGIENVKRRLDLYYNNDYEFDYGKKDNIYRSVIILKKPLKEQQTVKES